MLREAIAIPATRWLAIAICPPKAIAPSEMHRFPVLVGSGLPCPLPVHRVALGDLDRGRFFWVVRSDHTNDCSFDSSEDRLQGVVIGLWDGIELVVVAAGAVDGQDKVPHDVGDDVVAIEIPTDFSIERIFADISQ